MNDYEIHKLLGIPPIDIQDQAAQAIAETIQKIVDVTGKSITVPKVEWQLKGQTAGYAVGGYSIRLNGIAMLDHTSDMLQQTIPHEVAHIAMQQWYPNERVAHGIKWQTLMMLLGLPPTRCHNYDLPKARIHPRKFVYHCNCTYVHKVTSHKHTKMQRGQGRSCRLCGGQLIYSHTEG